MIYYLCYAAAIVLQSTFAALLKRGLLLKLSVRVAEPVYSADSFCYNGFTFGAEGTVFWLLFHDK